MRPLLSLLLSLALSDPAKSSPRVRRREALRRPHVEGLEDRTVPSALSVADVAVREGPANLGAPDPAGGAALGISTIRIMAFDTTPGSAHYHDLFVTSGAQQNPQVLRFDWASQTYQSFVAPKSGGITDIAGLAFGPDGNLYVSTATGNSVLEYDGTTGSFLGSLVPTGSGGLNWAEGMAFAPDGDLYVCSLQTNQILKYEGPTSPDGKRAGQFLGVFANTQHPPFNFSFGPDGNMYVSCPQTPPNTSASFIDEYYPPSSPLAGQFIRTLVANGAGGLHDSRTPLFDQQGNLYVADDYLNEVLEYQGPNGQSPGAYIQAYVTTGQGGLAAPNGMAIGPDGNLYVSSRDTAQVLRYAPNSQASFAVTLDSASTSQVSVNYATADGTAAAGTDYSQTSGTLVFPAGVTSETINVPITTVAIGGPTRTFTMNLSSPVNAMISRGQATGSILNRVTKFFVADGGTPKTYEYGSGGTSEEIAPETSGDTAPRGVATTAPGTTVWVVDANKSVYVYSNHGVLQGSWSAGGLSSSA
jgi:sugar lactone lactonase YvrE